MGKIQLIGLIFGILAAPALYCMDNSQPPQQKPLNQQSDRQLVLKKVCWYSKAGAYGALCFGSGMLLVTTIYDYATNNTPETPISVRFSAIGVALLGIKQFGWGAYEAVCKIIAENPNDLEESLYQRLLTRLSNTNISNTNLLATPPRSFSSLPPLTRGNGSVSQQSVSSFHSITQPNEFDTILETLGKAPDSLKASVPYNDPLGNKN